MMKKEDYMALALKEAEKGMGFVAPNPLVGAVIVKDDRIISKGYHKRFGDLHAERQAIKNADEDISGSTLYVTLEPCCHVGKQPPCTEALIKSGIKKVVVGSLDPNPLVSGKGIALLRKEGLNVEVGILREECDALNERFIFHMTYKQPFVYLKYAMTLDGKIATKTGDSKWISNEHSRQSVQKLRQKCSAIMVGINTVLADNPRLTCRIPKGEALVRIVCDSQLKIPLDSYLVKSAKTIPTWIATCSDNLAQQQTLKEMGCRLIKVPRKDGKLDLKVLMTILGQEGIDSLLIEGGSSLHFSALKAGIVNRLIVFIAPKIIGGLKAKTAISGEGLDWLNQAFRVKDIELSRMDSDVVIEGKAEHYVYRNY